MSYDKILQFVQDDTHSCHSEGAARRISVSHDDDTNTIAKPKEKNSGISVTYPRYLRYIFTLVAGNTIFLKAYRS